MAESVRTAAITYDPEYDNTERLRRYGEAREVRFDANHRLLRTTQGFQSLREHFRLGVNFVESLVNRHRVEAYLLDSKGSIAASFERVRWDEEEVVDRALELLDDKEEPTASRAPERGTPCREGGYTRSHRVSGLRGAGLARRGFLSQMPLC